MIGVQIGFEEVLYSVDESAGEVTLGVAILSGGLSSEVVVRLSTGDSSATGKRFSPVQSFYFIVIFLLYV